MTEPRATNPQGEHEHPHIKPVDASPELTGTVLADRYRILRKLGAGGMGSVYLAEHTTIGKKLAIKVLASKFTERADLVERFLREARATSMISQQNVIEISDFGDTPDGSVFFVMEHLVGEDLRDMLKREKRIGWPRVRHLIVQVCRALEAAHAAGIVHRDMKPDNVFRITRSEDPDFVKVLDFGIAKVQSAEGKGLTKTGMIFGTAEYMSPEQAQGNSSDPRVDIYAVGVIMYELLCGRVPFKGKNYVETLTKHMFNTVRPPSQRAPEAGIPPEAEALVLKAMQKDPSLRFASMAEMIAAIEAVGTGAAAVDVVHESVARPDTSGSMSFAGASAASMSASASTSLGAGLGAGASAVLEDEAPSLGGLWLGLGGLALAGGLIAFAVIAKPFDDAEPANDTAVTDEHPVAEQPVAEPAPAPPPTPAPTTAPAPAPEPSVAKLFFDTNVPVEILDASDRGSYGRSDDEAGIEVPRSDEPIALILVAEGFAEREVEVIPNLETKQFSFRLAKLGGKPKPKPSEETIQLPDHGGDSEVKNPFAK